MIKIHCSTCTNEDCFVKHTTPEWISKLDTLKNQTLYRKGYHIFKHKDPVTGMYFIQEGKVKVVTVGLQGREQIVRLATDGHILGHRGMGAETYPVGAIAMEDSFICSLDNATLYDAYMQNPNFTYELMRFYSRELRKIEIRMKYLGQMNVREKIAETLLYLIDVFGINDEDNTIDISMSRQDIADIACTAPNRISTQLKEFEDENLIARKKRTIIIEDIEGLRKVVAAFNVKEFFDQR